MFERLLTFQASFAQLRDKNIEPRHIPIVVMLRGWY